MPFRATRQKWAGNTRAGKKRVVPDSGPRSGLVFPYLVVLCSCWLPMSVRAATYIEGHASTPAGASPIPISIATEVAHDSARFVNGDRLTGTVKAIADGVVSFTLYLTDEAAEFPLSNFSEVSFAGPPRFSGARLDAIYLRDGSRLSARVTLFKDNLLEAETVFGQAIVVPQDRVLGMGFYNPDDIVFESDFSQGGQGGFVPVLGSWAVEKGQFVQASPVPFCQAYIPVVQTGMMSYEWGVDVSQSYNAGLVFFASEYDTRFSQFAYMVMVRGRDVYFYKLIGRAQQSCARERIKSADSVVHLKAEYDPRTGEAVVWEGKDILTRIFDPKPIRRGKYVLLHTEGKGAFDDVRVAHLVGTIDDTPPQGQLDSVLLSNGDRVSGRLVEVSDRVVLKSPYTALETAIDRRKVRSISFAASHRDGPAQNEASHRISLWSGDLILGTVIKMDDLRLTVKTCFVPELFIGRADLRSITFRRVSLLLPPLQTTPATVLTVRHGQEANAPANAIMRNSP